MDRISSSIHPIPQNIAATELQNPGGAAASSMPPVRGPLPYTKAEYDNLLVIEKTPGLNFLILGEFQDSGDRGSQEFRERVSGVVSECIYRGEWEALKYFSEKTGIDLNKYVLRQHKAKFEQAHTMNLAEACSIFPGMKYELTWIDGEREAAAHWLSLVKNGNVESVYIGAHGPVEVSGAFLFPVVGKLTGTLVLNDIQINAEEEVILAESVANSTSLNLLCLMNVQFGNGQGALLVEAMKQNHSVTKFFVNYTPLPPASPVSGYPPVLAHNTRLESLKISFSRLSDEAATNEVDALLAGVKESKSLRNVSVHCLINGFLDDLPSLNRLLEANTELESLELGFDFQNDAPYQSIAKSLEKNTHLIEFSVGSEWNRPLSFRKSVQATLDRNRAIVDMEKMRIAGMAFDPDGTMSFADSGSVIARYILQNSSTIEEFADTMAAVELSMKELGKQVMNTPTPAFASGGIALTTDSTSSISATATATTTTTTDTDISIPPPASS